MSPVFEDKCFIIEAQTAWINKQPIERAHTGIYFSPFAHFIINNLFKSNALTLRLASEFNSVLLKRKQMDLYEFFQSKDLVESENSVLEDFYNCLKFKIMPLVETVTGIKLKNVSASLSMYNGSDFLLPHDDLMKDRKIAFIYYISPWGEKETWTHDMGGALEFFECRNNEPIFPIAKRIFPQNNTFIFFEVCDTSFHQVSEVTNFDFPRLTINGWFHGSNENLSIRPKIVQTLYCEPYQIDLTSMIKNIINPVYLKEESILDIKLQLEEASEVCLEDFFQESFYDEVLLTLQTAEPVCWTPVGPINVKNYETLNLNEAPTFLKQFIDIFYSQTFFTLLHRYTGLDLSGAEAKSPKCHIQLQRWTKGCYDLLVDDVENNEATLDLILYIGAYPHTGVITYLNSEENSEYSKKSNESESGESVLLTIYPKDNTFNVVYRSAGTTNFTKYVSKNSFNPGEHTFIIFCRYKE